MTEQPNIIQRNITLWAALAALLVALFVVYTPEQQPEPWGITVTSAQTHFPIEGGLQLDDEMVSNLCSFDVDPGAGKDYQVWMAYATADWIKVRAPYVGPVFDFYVLGNEGPGSVEFEIAPNCEAYEEQGVLVFKNCGLPRTASINIKAVRATNTPDERVSITQMGLSAPPEICDITRNDAGLTVQWHPPQFGDFDEFLVIWRKVDQGDWLPMATMAPGMAALGEWVDFDASPHENYAYRTTFSAGSNPLYYSEPSNEATLAMPKR